MLTKTVLRTGLNPNVLVEKNHPGECVVSELGNYQCRGNRVVAGGVSGVPHNCVLLKADGHFDGVVLEGVKVGETAMRGVIENGPCELSEAKLDWSKVVVTDAVDGPDAGSDTTAENAAATAAKRDAIRAEMRAVGIKFVGLAPTIPAGR